MPETMGCSINQEPANTPQGSRLRNTGYLFCYPKLSNGLGQTFQTVTYHTSIQLLGQSLA